MLEDLERIYKFLEENNMLDKVLTMSAITLAILVLCVTPRAQAADTKDVIGALILGGIIGSEIQKGNSNKGMNTVILPSGATIITPSYRKDGERCHWILDQQGVPVYASPICETIREPKSWYPTTPRMITPKDRYEESYPCGNYWGYKCGKLIRQLKGQ